MKSQKYHLKLGGLKAMDNRPSDHEHIEKISEVSGTCYFDDNTKRFLEEVIKDLYYSHQQELICNLRAEHIIRAIFKYREAKGKRRIHNTKQYFKSCLVSAIKETELEELEPLDFLDSD